MCLQNLPSCPLCLITLWFIVADTRSNILILLTNICDVCIFTLFTNNLIIYCLTGLGRIKFNNTILTLQFPDNMAQHCPYSVSSAHIMVIMTDVLPPPELPHICQGANTYFHSFWSFVKLRLPIILVLTKVHSVCIQFLCCHGPLYFWSQN